MLLNMKHLIFKLIVLISVVLVDSNRDSEDVKHCKIANSEPFEFDVIAKWANSLPVLQFQDVNRANLLFETSVNHLSPAKWIRDRFYQVTSQPLQTVCTVGKQIGGTWLGNCGHFDGQKFVCLDKLYGDIQRNKCLVYSFGVADDWSFEEVMAGLGCQIRAFDPTVTPDKKPKSELISFSQLGLGNVNGKKMITDNLNQNRKVLVDVVTLKESVKRMGDEGKKISYLKVDIEGSELDAIQEWIDSGILETVDQIGIEFHTGELFLKENKIAQKLYGLLESLKQLHLLGFRIISNTPNNCVGKSQDIEKRFYTFFDIVLYKHKTSNEIQT